MKKTNKKAFTLIELLAVIVILAIIALIAVPIIMNIINKTNTSAFKDTAYGIINAGELYFAQQQLELNGMKEDKIFDLSQVTELELKGEIPEGSILVTKEGKTAIAVTNGRYCITKGINDKDITVTENHENCELPKEKATLPITWYAGTDTSGLTTILDEEGNVFAYKISDYAEPIDKLEGISIELNAFGQSFTDVLSIENGTLVTINENLYAIGDMFLINLVPNNDLGGVIVSEVGTYLNSEAIDEVSVSIGGRLKSTVVITENSIKWDGNTRGLECVQDQVSETNNIRFCKVSDEIPSTDISAYKSLVGYDTDDGYFTFSTEDANTFVLSEDGTYMNLFLVLGLVIFDDEISLKEAVFSKGVWFMLSTNPESGEIKGYTSELYFDKGIK